MEVYFRDSITVVKRLRRDQQPVCPINVFHRTLRPFESLSLVSIIEAVQTGSSSGNTQALNQKRVDQLRKGPLARQMIASTKQQKVASEVCSPFRQVSGPEVALLCLRIDHSTTTKLAESTRRSKHGCERVDPKIRFQFSQNKAE